MAPDWGEGPSNANENEGNGAEAQAGDATWILPFYGRDRAWKTPGGDFAADASATTTVDDLGPYTWSPTPEMVADIQAWLDEPDTGFG